MTLILNNFLLNGISISVITVTLNQKANLLTTLNSVQIFINSNTSLSIEHIIVDGKSNDGSLELLESFHNPTLKFISEKDNGVYHAMNKGVRMAKNNHVVFINAGDLINLKEIDNILTEKFKSAQNNDKIAGVAFSSLYHIGVILRRVSSRHVTFNRPIMPGLHQGMLYKRNLLLEIPFNENLKICGDFEQFARMNQKGFYFIPINDIFSTLFAGGISSKNPLLLFKESTWVTSNYYDLGLFTKIKTKFLLLLGLALVQAILLYSTIVSLFHTSNSIKNNA